MPIPHFTDLAFQITARDVSTAERTQMIADILRATWNQRGADDAAAVDACLATLTGWVTSEPYRQSLRAAIEALTAEA